LKVVALIPARNESATIASVILRAEDHVDEVVVLDDGSTDDTALIAEGLGAVLIRRERSWGKGDALRTLFLKAMELEADAAVTLDADGQHDPHDIPKLLEALKDADMVIGSRTLSGVRAVGNRMLSEGGYDVQSGFRAYRASVLPDLIPSEMGMGADAEIFQKAKDLGLKMASVPVSSTEAVPNPHKTNVAVHGLDLAFTSFKLATFRHPLALYGLPGLLFVALGLWFAAGDFPYLVAQGFGSVVLLLLGLFSLSTGVIIWTVVSLTRRSQA
jgi:hypothetical protein